jgi:hypothetical protein
LEYFFKAKGVQINKGGTIEDLLNALKDIKLGKNNYGSMASHFGYISNNDPLVRGPDDKGNGKSIVAFAVNYPNGVTSSTSGVKYPSGSYYLAENNVTYPKYSVWQYYVFNGGNFIGNPKPLQSYSTRVLEEGDKVTWRLVEILGGPNIIPQVYANKLGFSTLLPTADSPISPDRIKIVNGVMDYRATYPGNVRITSGVRNSDNKYTFTAVYKDDGIIEVTYLEPFKVNSTSVTTSAQIETSGGKIDRNRSTLINTNVLFNSYEKCVIKVGGPTGKGDGRYFISFTTVGLQHSDADTS